MEKQLMRKIIVSNLISLDGYFEGPNKELDWFVTDQDFFDYARELLNSVDIILFGRKTYEMMAAYWPNATENDAAITHKMNNLTKIVFSKTLSSVNWNNSRLADTDVKEEINKLKQQPGKDIVIFGSGELVSSLADLGLIDEYRVILNPVSLGKGNSMFKNLKKRLDLKLLKTKPLWSGVLILYYRPVGNMILTN